MINRKYGNAIIQHNSKSQKSQHYKNKKKNIQKGSSFAEAL